MKKLYTIFLIVIASIFFLSCSDNSVGTTNSEFNDCVGESLPFPATATITACFGPRSELIKGAVFEPGISWSKTTEFFSKNYSSGRWTMVEERIPTATAGEREAEWTIRGPDFDIGINVTAFGDDELGFMVGTFGMYQKGTL